MVFGSLVGSSKWGYKFWSFLNPRNLLLIDCIIVYSQKICNWHLQMKSNLKWFFKITTIASYLKLTSTIQEKGPFGKSQSKVIYNSSFTLSNFLCIARNLERKNKAFVPRDKNDQICTTAYTYSTKLYSFHMLLKFVQSQCLISDTFP